ncbi:galactose-1-epimerase [Pterulicium gracile]|uniref:Galactose-1-epimerase n=1 Tax=Pterulicium gracile TaxID=1884261 RepID=A0A5C3Q8X7_9AGAR|nr:galactose-1-epimerase [Pterula gracilis]
MGRITASYWLQLALVVGTLFTGSDATAPRPPKQAANWPFDITTVSAPDGSITAKFASVGATMMELWVRDSFGKKRDVILGYDDPTRILTDPDHPVFNSIVGRYANRIKNGSFSIPITKEQQPPGPNVYQIPTNSAEGQVTLHGGIIGWDRRNWTISEKKPSSVTYKHIDDGDEGFPGKVIVYAKHEVSNGGVLKTSVYATATEKTPIMVTQHNYWNLDAFQNNVTTALKHRLRMDASRVLATDGNGVPTGEFIDVKDDHRFDFRKERPIDKYWEETQGLCGAGGYCKGYDHTWAYDKKQTLKRSGSSLWSESSGIRVDMATNQAAVQMYTAMWLNTPRKAAHGGPSEVYSAWAGVAIEQQGYVAAINTPEFGQDQIYGPDRPFEWTTVYKFSQMPVLAN